MIYIGLGSNQGRRVAWLRRGVRGLLEAGHRITAASSLYLTEPVGNPYLPWFVNCVVALDPALSWDPSVLLRTCMRIESSCGRRRSTAALQPRTLDLDLLLHGDLVTEGPNLTLPHPRMHLRQFVLTPLVELAPTARHPIQQTTVSELLEKLEAPERVHLLAPGSALAVT